MVEKEGGKIIGGRKKKYATLDRPASIQTEHLEDFDPEDFFVGRINQPDGETVQPNISKLWTEDGYTCPEGYNYFSVLSKEVFEYPALVATLAFPTLSEFDNVFRVGLEGGSGHKLPHYQLQEWGGTNFRIEVSAKQSTNLEITDLMPDDYDTGINYYTLKLNRHSFNLFINGILRGTILLGVPEGVPTHENTHPYVIGSHPLGVVVDAPSKIELKKGGTVDLSYGGAFQIKSAEPRPARQFPLHDEDNQPTWSNLATGGSIQTSHPVPIWGYPNKTLYFKADAGGDLDIEVYVGGGWEVYDSRTVTANALEHFSLPAEMQAPLMRCVYTPTDADTINLAEVDLS